MYTFNSLEDYDQQLAKADDVKIKQRRKHFEFIISRGCSCVDRGGHFYIETTDGRVYIFYSKLRVGPELVGYEWKSGWGKKKYKVRNLETLFTKFIEPEIKVYEQK